MELKTVDIPKSLFANRRKWDALREALLANPGKAQLVPASEASSAGALSSILKTTPRWPHKVSISTTPDGFVVWLRNK